MTTDKPTVWRRNFLIQIFTTKQLIGESQSASSVATNVFPAPRTSCIHPAHASSSSPDFLHFFPGSIRKSRETLTKDIHGPWQSLQKKTCTSLTTSCISKYILKFICCQVWTESMAKGEETKFTQSTRVGSINRSHKKWTLSLTKLPLRYMTYFFPHRGRSRLNPLPRFFDHSHGGTKCLLLIGGVAIFKLSIFYHFLPLWNLLKVCCISSDRSPPPKKKNSCLWRHGFKTPSI